MKTFDEWLEKNKEKINPQNGIEWLNWSSGAREAWKAALQWTLEQESYDDYGCLRVNVFAVEKELDNV